MDKPTLARVLCALALFAASARGEDPATISPFACIYDTGSASQDLLPEEAVAAKNGWSRLPEDETSHGFQGDVVLVNDKLAVVLRAKGEQAEVYSQTAEGPRLRAAVAPLDTPRAAAGIGSLRIVQNSPSSAVLQASFGTTGRKSTIEFRLAAGQIGLEMLPRDAAKVRVRSRTRYVVVPDFFGDDMVLSPQMFRRTRLGLPAEKFFLNLLDGGDAMLMCVWQSAEARADAILSADAHEPLIAGCDIGCGKDKSLWVAFLEGADLWHEQSIPAEKASQDVSLDWRVPFSAKWRADFLRPDGFASSWYFPSSEFNDSRSMGPNAQPCPCAFRAGQASVRAELGCAGVVVYPIDRTRSTPLTAFCPIDILRSTLGVGPCQYILQTEGLASETNPTPDEVVTWAEKQFKKKKVSKAEILERFQQMVDYVGRAQSRLDCYAGWRGNSRRFWPTKPGRAAIRMPSRRCVARSIDWNARFLAQPPRARPPRALWDGSGSSPGKSPR